MQVIALGDVAWVSLPGEIFVELGLAVKKGSPFAHTLIAELANGSVGYIPNRDAYPQGNYEVVSAAVAGGLRRAAGRGRGPAAQGSAKVIGGDELQHKPAWRQQGRRRPPLLALRACMRARTVCVQPPPAGSRTRNVVPVPGADSNSTVPPCSPTILWVTNSPSPVPCFLVVKYGRKIAVAVGRVDPRPVVPDRHLDPARRPAPPSPRSARPSASRRSRSGPG